MKKLIFALCLLTALPILSISADTLVLAHKTSQLVIPLNRGNIECSIDMQFPVNATKTLCGNIATRLNASVCRALDLKALAETPALPLTDIENNFVKLISSQMQTIKRDAKATGLTLDVLMQREYETAQLITFRIETVYYGLDGNRKQLTDRITLLKSNGKVLTWADMLNKKQKERFCRAAARSLNGYFGVMDYINLKNALTIAPNTAETSFPLPTGGPAINADGLCLLYAPGEICSPDKGQPSGNLKLQSVWNCLSPTAKKWLK